jgi:DNA-binding response OmpR family regulator
VERDLNERASVFPLDAVTPWGLLPPSLRVLFVSEKSHIGLWVVESLKQESICKVLVAESSNPLLALERLREESFDAVVVAHEGVQTLDWIEAIRVGSTAIQPILVLGSVADREFSALCFESGADGFLTVDSITTRELVWHLARAAERRRLMEENDRHRSLEHRRRTVERDETLRVLAEQRAILNLEPASEQPEWLTNRSRELLTTYVVMGTGQLTDEMDRFITAVKSAGVDRVAVLRAFHDAMKAMVAELGTRSARHILNRGNVLLLETLLKISVGSSPSATPQLKHHANTPTPNLTVSKHVRFDDAF